jgi:hypothetical protein
MRRYIVRIFAGWAFWLAMLAIYESYQYWGRGHVPKMLRETVEFAIGIIAFAAWPMAVGGWLAWGEGWWIFSIPANIAVGLVLYGVLGVGVGVIYGTLRRRVKA